MRIILAIIVFFGGAALGYNLLMEVGAVLGMLVAGTIIWLFSQAKTEQK